MVEVNLITPATWRAQHFWITRGKHTAGIVLAIAPTVFAVGLEVIRGDTKGVGVMVGPLWIGLALRAANPDAPHAR
jgi:hypothetical protein